MFWHSIIILFRHLVRRIRFELNVTLGAFFDPSGEADIDRDFEEGKFTTTILSAILGFGW